MSLWRVASWRKTRATFKRLTPASRHRSAPRTRTQKSQVSHAAGCSVSKLSRTLCPVLWADDRVNPRMRTPGLSEILERTAPACALPGVSNGEDSVSCLLCGLTPDHWKGVLCLNCSNDPEPLHLITISGVFYRVVGVHRLAPAQKG